MGWKVDENGEVIKDKVQPLYVTSSPNICIQNQQK